MVTTDDEFPGDDAERITFTADTGEYTSNGRLRPDAGAAVGGARRLDPFDVGRQLDKDRWGAIIGCSGTHRVRSCDRRTGGDGARES